MPIALRTKVGRAFAAALKEENEREHLAERGRQLQAAQDAFLSGFGRSRKGNLWRMVSVCRDGVNIEKLTVTVFGQTKCKICVADVNGPHYGDSVYDCEADAILALWWGLRHYYGPEVDFV